MQPTPETGMEAPQPAGKRRGGKRTLLIAVISLVGFLVIVGIATGIFAWRFNSDWKKIVIENVGLSRIPDGAYEGEAKNFHDSSQNFHDSSQVRVTVQDHSITAIDILKTSPGGNRAKMEELARRIIASQTPNVDLITGASASSKVFQKAVDNALIQAQP